MMKELFSLFLQAGIAGSILIAVILTARLFLRWAPRRILCVLWLLAVLRLLIPFQIESIFSLQPAQPSFSATVQEETAPPSFSEPNTLPEAPIVTPQNTAPAPASSPSVDYFLLISVAWGIVTCGFMLYGIISYLVFKAKVADAIRQPNGTKECANINNAFLIGLFCPVIYLPTNLSPQDRDLIIAHEKAHIAHGDNWWKILSFLCLCLHWYNPFVWLSFHFFNNDMEIACDEKVVRHLDVEPRKAYSMALLRFGKRSYMPYSPSSSFGKVNLKQRLQYILSYKTPRLWISVVAILLTAVIAVCFLTSPKNSEQNPQPDLQASGTPTGTQLEAAPEKPTKDDSTPSTSDEPNEPNAPNASVEEITQPADTDPPAPPVTKPSSPQVPEPEPPVTEPPDTPTSNTRKFDLEAVDTTATNYAADLGFQTLDNHPNGNVPHFTTSCLAIPMLTLSQLQDTANQAVDAAYRYCISNQYPVSSSVLWINIHYDGYMMIYVIHVYCAV